jgi:hypothetical protein
MLRTTVAGLALAGVLLTAGVALADPTKENAVKALNDFLAALEGKDYKKAGTFLQGTDKAPAAKLEKELSALLERKEISKKGIEILAAKGKWGKLTEVFDADKAKRMAERFKVDAAACYGLALGNAEAGFHWDGKRFTLIRVDDIGKLE